jgi:hypothetical protein
MKTRPFPYKSNRIVAYRQVTKLHCDIFVLDFYKDTTKSELWVEISTITCIERVPYPYPYASKPDPHFMHGIGFFVYLNNKLETSEITAFTKIRVDLADHMEAISLRNRYGNRKLTSYDFMRTLLKRKVTL